LSADGGSFIRANKSLRLPLSYESGIHQFLEALQEMGRSWRNKAQGGVTRPANGERRFRSRHGSAESKKALRVFLPTVGKGKTYHGGTDRDRVIARDRVIETQRKNLPRRHGEKPRNLTTKGHKGAQRNCQDCQKLEIEKPKKPYH
jgi:hypothetical protein